MQWFYQTQYFKKRNEYSPDYNDGADFHLEFKNKIMWKGVALRAYLCWSVCVDMAALCGILWYIFK